jgi:hypothetical protein
MKHWLTVFLVGLSFGILFFFGSALGYNPLVPNPLHLLSLVVFAVYAVLSKRRSNKPTLFSLMIFEFGFFAPILLWWILVLVAVRNWQVVL